MRKAVAGLCGLLWGAGMLIAAPTASADLLLAVDTYEDTFDGSCADGDCSLRDAVASVDPGGTIQLPPGFYPLSLAGPGGVEEGDVDVDRAMTIVGVGETGSFLDASALGDRAIDVTADASLRHVTLLGGSPVSTGGLVRVRQAALRLTSVTLVGGRATQGGALAVGGDAALRLERSWISGSRAGGRGGAIFLQGDGVVTRSTLSGNRAQAGGGAWVGPGGSLRIRDATVSGNRADGGGGGVRVEGELALESATAARNRAAVGGAVMATAAAVAEVRSSVFGDNEASVRGPSCSRRLTSGGHNVADSGTCGLSGPGDRPGTEPAIGLLRQNGGPTPTHALRGASPAIGNGGGCSSLDQRGAPRKDCDSGAYELVFCLGRPVTIVGTAGSDEFSGGLGKDVFLGRGGDDEFQGSLDDDRACGGAGHDRLIGGPDRDRLSGQAGDDGLLGEGGPDLLIGGSGEDVCRGGQGADVRRGCERGT